MNRTKMCLDEQLDRIERMLKWLTISFMTEFNWELLTGEQREKLKSIGVPYINDILEE